MRPRLLPSSLTSRKTWGGGDPGGGWAKRLAVRRRGTGGFESREELLSAALRGRPAPGAQRAHLAPAGAGLGRGRLRRRGGALVLGERGAREQQQRAQRGALDQQLAAPRRGARRGRGPAPRRLNGGRHRREGWPSGRRTGVARRTEHAGRARALGRSRSCVFAPSAPGCCSVGGRGWIVGRSGTEWHAAGGGRRSHAAAARGGGGGEKARGRAGAAVGAGAGAPPARRCSTRAWRWRRCFSSARRPVTCTRGPGAGRGPRSKRAVNGRGGGWSGRPANARARELRPIAAWGCCLMQAVHCCWGRLGAAGARRAPAPTRRAAREPWPRRAAARGVAAPRPAHGHAVGCRRGWARARRPSGCAPPHSLMSSCATWLCCASSLVTRHR
jgi:hypothetical protein